MAIRAPDGANKYSYIRCPNLFDILQEKKKISVPARVILMSNVQTCLIFPQARSSSGNAHPLQRQNSARAEANTDFFFLGEEVI